MIMFRGIVKTTEHSKNVRMRTELSYWNLDEALAAAEALAVSIGAGIHSIGYDCEVACAGDFVQEAR